MSRNHKSKHRHSHNHGKGGIDKTTRQVYWKILLFYFLVAILGLLACLIFDNKPTVSDAEFAGMDFMQQAVIIVFRFFLNFPLGISNWFSNNYAATTYLFFIPDSLLITWLLLKIFPHKSRIDKVLNFVLAIMIILMLIFAVISLLSDVHLGIRII